MAVAMTAAPMAVGALDVAGLADTLALLALPVLLLLAIVYAHRAGQRQSRQAEDLGPRQPGERLGVVAAPEGAVAGATTREPPQPLPPPVAEVPWPERIRRAEADGDPVALGTLYLGWARDEIARGSTAPAGEHLRTAVRIAAQSKAASLHAEARLELAELARVAGDLTTACEHWQLARALFYDLKQRDRVGDTERLMQRHGCPTDWVLNDF